jgi:CHASE2 domain-containing sensor protein
LPETVAHLAGAKTNAVPENKWIRYYGANGTGYQFSYHLALGQPATYFRDKIVFIGNKPETTVPDGEVDKFRTPYTRWTGRTVGGVEILATEF